MTEPQSFLDGRVVLHAGDCREVLRGIADNSVDSVVTDPPYHLTSIVKRFGKSNLERDESNLQLPSNKGGGGTTSPHKRVAGGFMGKQWDGGDIAFQPELWAAVLRVLKPGAHGLAMGGTRTFHRLVCAIEDAGAEIRDCLVWTYGSGFPKSLSVSKQLDKMEGVEREPSGIEPRRPNPRAMSPNGYGARKCDASTKFDIPASNSAREWDGWGTALKPAVELICMFRKPLSEASVAANVLKWGTGAIFINGARVRHRTMDTILNRARRTSSRAAHEFGNNISCTDLSPGDHEFHRTLGKRLSAVVEHLSAAAHEDDRAQILSSPPDCLDRYSIYSRLCDALFHISKDDVRSSVQQQLYAHKRNHPSMPYDGEDHGLIDIDYLYECMTHLANLDSLLQSDPQANVQFLAEPLSRAVEEYLKSFLDYTGIESPIQLNPDHLHKVSRWLVLCPLETTLAGGNLDVGSTCESILINILLGPHLITNSLHLLIKIIENYGRWPSNLLLDNSEEVLSCFPETGISRQGTHAGAGGDNLHGLSERERNDGFGDSGSAARFFASFPQEDDDSIKRIFYHPKADSVDRAGSRHPTIKPVSLKRYLAKLITPHNGLCLDLFAGSGTTGEACYLEGFRASLVEREAEYLADIERRMALVMEGPVTRAHAGMKARGRPRDDGPLFGGSDEPLRHARPTGCIRNGAEGPFGKDRLNEAAE